MTDQPHTQGVCEVYLNDDNLSVNDNMRGQYDSGLENLLALHGEIYDQGKGYWVKVEAWQTTPSERVMNSRARINC